MGNQGTGKSTLVTLVASKIPGVIIYVAITGRSTENGSTVRGLFSNTFAAALNWKVPYIPSNEVIWGVRWKKPFSKNPRDLSYSFSNVYTQLEGTPHR
jgi:hypothetical protein